MKFANQFIALLVMVALVDIAQGQESKVEQKKGIVRKKFFFSIGAGAALVYTNAEVSPMYPSKKIRTNSFDWAFASTFRMGGAPTPNLVIYYENKVCFANTATLENEVASKQERLFHYSLTGIGVTRFLKPTMPSWYFNATAGIASRIEETLPDYAEKGTGFGMALGSGYQFSNRWSVEANLIYGDVSGNPQDNSSWKSKFICMQISINYLYFKSYKLDRLNRKRDM